MRTLRQAFTLMEVNLAIFIMATGVLAMVSLYSLGFRENRQSVEDVASAGYADAFLAPLVAGLSATNMTWSKWQQIGTTGDETIMADALLPENGWRDYIEVPNEKGESFRVVGNANALANTAFQDAIRQTESPYKNASVPSFPDYYYGLVVTRRGANISLAFRASRRLASLLNQPVYYVDVHFQGVGDK